MYAVVLGQGWSGLQFPGMDDGASKLPRRFLEGARGAPSEIVEFCCEKLSQHCGKYTIMIHTSTSIDYWILCSPRIVSP